jgi:hypothetical protein
LLLLHQFFELAIDIHSLTVVGFFVLLLLLAILKFVVVFNHRPIVLLKVNELFNIVGQDVAAISIGPKQQLILF